MGSGLGNWDANSATVTGTPGCGYLGTYSRTVSPSTGATITLIVQVLGIKKSGGCNSTPSTSEFDATDTYQGAFELARSTVDVNGQTTGTLTSAYNPATASDTRCYLGGTFPAAADNDLTGTLMYQVVRASTTAAIDTIMVGLTQQKLASAKRSRR